MLRETKREIGFVKTKNHSNAINLRIDLEASNAKSTWIEFLDR